MKTKTLLLASALLAAWSVQAAERVDVSKLPAPVKSALQASDANEPVKEVTIHTVDGRTVYDVEFDRHLAPNPHLRIAADGTVLRDTRKTLIDPATDFAVYSEYPAPAYVPRLKLADLPAAAQRTINQEANGRAIAEITSDLVNGRPAYKVEFSERGRNPRFFVAENGKLLSPPEKPPVLGLGTTFTQTPAAVQRTIRDEIGDGEITKIDKDGRAGSTVIYKVDLKDNQGAFQLHIGADGKVLKNTRR